MKIIIDIPEGIKNDFESEQWTALSCMEMKNALEKGTPLPKGHSGLIAEPTEEDIAKTIGGQSDFADCIRDSVKAVYNNAPTVEAIPKNQYEARLKADLKAILVELQLEIEEKAIRKQGIDSGFEYDYEFISSEEVIELIQQKINKLKEVEI